jgi:hypothetical protein
MISSSIRALNTKGLTGPEARRLAKVALVSLIEVSLLAGGYGGRPLDITIRCARGRKLRADSRIEDLFVSSQSFRQCRLMLYYAIQPFKTGLPHAIQPFPSIPFHIDLVQYLVSQCKRPFQKNLTPSASPLTICALPRLTSVSSDRRRRTGGS